ncbi:MAG: trigger factor [Candidatus Desulfofervidus auxilii]|nr:trigger factor [Candidatus Desulfofervidus auxilii]
MEVRVEEISPAKRRLEIIVPKERVESKINALYENLRKKAKIKGFRPGKAPMALIKSLYRNEVLNQALTDLIEQTYPEALKEVKIIPLKETSIEPDNITEGEAFKYAVTIEVIPEFELPEYKGVTVEVSPIVVTDEEIETELKRLQEMHAELKSIEEKRPLKEGDYVILDFQGYLDGQPLKDFKATDYMAELGQNQLHKDIEKEILGSKVGEKKIVKLRYPEDIKDKKLAGKEIELHLFIKDAKEKVLPALDDEFAKSLGEYNSLEELKENLKKQMLEKKEKMRDEYIKNYILNYLTEKAEIELPETLVEEELENMIDRATYFISPEARKSMDREKLKNDLRSSAERKVKAQLILSKIAKQENITAEEKEVEEEIKLMAERLRVPVEKMQTPYVINRIKTRIIGEKTLVFLKDNANIKEKNKEEN